MPDISLILTYHRIVQPEDVSRFYDLSIPQFCTQLDSIAARSEQEPQRILVTFDDGTIDHRRVAEMLAERHMRGIFFIIVNRLGMSGYLTQGDVRRLGELGHEIGSHTLSHRHLPRLDDVELTQELIDSRRRLEDLVDRQVSWFCAPGGFLDRRSFAAAKSAGYSHVRTMDWGYAPALDECGEEGPLPTVPILRSTREKRFRAILDGRARFPMFRLKQLLKRVLPGEAYAFVRNSLVPR